MSKGLDYFRMAAAFMIVAIHTAPFEIIGETTDFVITYCLFRVAVPFFLMVSGYFVVADYWKGNKEKIDKYLGKLILIYLAATIIYLPVNIYAGKTVTGVGQFFKILFFEGTFYHLWYLPAAILGCQLVKFFHWIWGVRGSGLIVLILYVAGTLGDSYYGLVEKSYIGREFYKEIFVFSQYTRNGLFYAPMFLWLGAAVHKITETKVGQEKQKVYTTGFAVSALFMVLEGLWTFKSGWQRHNSMYFMLIPVMFFLFCMLLGESKNENAGREQGLWQSRLLRPMSMWIYILHPFCIILVRGGARVLGFTGYLVENSLIHYLAVCVLSAVLAGGLCLFSAGRRTGAKHG